LFLAAKDGPNFDVKTVPLAESGTVNTLAFEPEAGI
jgi:hypothetical protein